MTYGYADEDYEDEDYCSSCGRNLNESVKGCPDCCSASGLFIAGSEYCEFCYYSKECRGALRL